MVINAAEPAGPSAVVRPSLAARPFAAPGRLSLDECRRNVPDFVSLLGEVARHHHVSDRALRTRALLHLPRLARPNGTLVRRQVIAELARNAVRLRLDQRSADSVIPKDKYDLSDLRFERLSDHMANEIFGRLHYLCSTRPGSMNFALVDPLNHLPVTLCSLSLLEWQVVARQLHRQFGVSAAAVLDVSRVYSFDVAPPNAISYLLSRVAQVLRRELPDIQLLSTAVDPTIGFTGASYRSANWERWMSVEPRPYMYVDRAYQSLRQLRTRFGNTNLYQLQRTNPGIRFEQSRTRLLDPVIFCYRLRGETECVPLSAQRRLRRGSQPRRRT